MFLADFPILFYLYLEPSKKPLNFPGFPWPFNLELTKPLAIQNKQEINQDSASWKLCILFVV